MISAREAAYRSLVKISTQNKYSNLETDASIKKFGLEGAEKSLYTRLVYGVSERRITLDYYIGAFSDKPTDDIDTELKIILEIALYQMLYCERIPNHAIVNEAVETAKRHGKHSSDSFVNAVLRRAARDIDKVTLPLDENKRLSIEYSMPEWICRHFISDYGKEKAGEILDAVNEIPYMTLRVNTLKTTKDELCSVFADNGISFEKGELEESLHIVGNADFGMIEKIAGEKFFVQDEASQTAVKTLSPKKGNFVIDTCACPGGKSFGMAMLMENEGKILSLDLHKNKLSLVEEGAKRLGIDIIETAEHNGKAPIEEFIGKADCVLCDVPCSGLGVIAKKPEIRYKSKEEIERLPEIQSQILCAGGKYLKKGGKLLYSTCTLNKKENENVVEDFLHNNKGYKLLSMQTIFPKKRTSDGFFFALIEKTE